MIEGLQSENEKKDKSFAAIQNELKELKQKLLHEAAKNRSLTEKVEKLSKENEVMKEKLVKYDEMKQELEKLEIEKIRKSFEEEWYAS